MKLSIASALIVDVDFADTVDVSPRYADAVLIFQASDAVADTVAQAWLDVLASEATESERGMKIATLVRCAA